MTFDVVVATRNRPAELARLVGQIIESSPEPCQVVIVDSSDKANDEIRKLSSKVRYLHVHEGNQPFQRYAGLLRCNADVVVFFDDDIEIADSNIFRDILGAYRSMPDVVGVGTGVDYSNNISLLGRGELRSTLGLWFRVFNTFTGVSIPEEGRIAKAGITGGARTSDGDVDFFNGPMMSFRRSIALELFDVELFNAYSQRVGKGEDKYISMGALRFGKLRYLSKYYVRHPLNESHYFADMRGFQKRVMFSRWLLSRRLAKTRGDSILLYRVHFVWFALWRILIALAMSILKAGRVNRQILRGQLDGINALLWNFKVITTCYDRDDWIRRI